MISIKNCRETSCMFCLKAITDTHFKVLDESIRDILDILFLKLELDDSIRHVICTDCSIKLNAVFEFKSTCLNTDNTIIPYMNHEGMLQLDFKEILKRNGSKNLMTLLPDDQQICRLCMQVVDSEFRWIGEEEVEAILKLAPEMIINIIKDPIICKTCFHSLYTHNNFIKECNKNICDTFTPDLFFTTENFEIKSEINEQEDAEMLIKPEYIEIKSDQQIGDSDISLPIFNEGATLNSSCRDTDKATDIHDFTMFNNFTDHQPSSNDVLYKCDTHEFGGMSEPNPLQHTNVPLKCNQDYNTCFLNYLSDPEVRKRTNHKMKYHKHIHNGKPITQKYKCIKCDFQTNNVSCFAVHSAKHINGAEASNCAKSESETKDVEPPLKHKNVSKTTKYKCINCTYTANNMKDFVTHNMTHRDAGEMYYDDKKHSNILKVYRCEKCDYLTKTKDCFQRHLMSHQKPSETQMYKCVSYKILGLVYQCSQCDYETTYKKNFQLHFSIHKNPLKCYACNFETERMCDLKSHQKMHRKLCKEQMYKCDVCDYGTDKINLLITHQGVHKGLSMIETNPTEMRKTLPEVQMYKCDSCGFETKCILKAPQQSHENLPQTLIYKCDMCGVEFKHQKPSEAQMYKCDLCDFETECADTLKTHEEIHRSVSEQQMYKCDVCDYHTDCMTVLNTHQEIHKNVSMRKEVQKHKCNICGFETDKMDSLMFHLLKHKEILEVRIHKCDMCDSEIVYRYCHSSERNPLDAQLYKCGICGFETFVFAKQNTKDK